MTIEERKNQREIEFTDWWFSEHKGAPTYADAIEWADKTMIEKACECIIKLHNWPTQYEEYAKLQEEFIKGFKKAMEG